MNVVWKVCMKTNLVLKLFTQVSPQALHLCARYKHLINRNVVCTGFCTQQNFCVSFDDPAVQKYLEKLVMEFKALQTEDDRYEGNKRRKLLEIQPVIDLLEERKAVIENLACLKELISDVSKDKEFQSAANEEQQIYREKLKELENMLLSALVPHDDEDRCSDIVLEVSAGVGGQEAMLFARELFDMYCNYITYKDWDMQTADLELSELGGLRHASLLVSGKDAYRYLKYEAGVHRVQRVPATEKSGRIHTSTVSVAVLPQPEEVDIVLQDKDLNVETKRASGAGGQHVNKTESAVRITHLPTGLSVECQVDRSQIKNRQIALQTLKARIYQRQLEAQVAATQAARKQQVGSSMRSEKIRTYNFNQDRITDHRLNVSLYNMCRFLVDGKQLDSLIDKLQVMRSRDKLLEVLSSAQSQ